MNACGHCRAPLTTRRLTSRALKAAFCGWGCYDAGWKLRDVGAQQEGWQVDAWSSGIGVHAGENGAIIPIEGESMARAADE